LDVFNSNLVVEANSLPQVVRCQALLTKRLCNAKHDMLRHQSASSAMEHPIEVASVPAIRGRCIEVAVHSYAAIVRSGHWVRRKAVVLDSERFQDRFLGDGGTKEVFDDRMNLRH